MTSPTAQRTLTLGPDLVVTVRESGAGSPVLLLHGAAGPASITALAEHLATRYRVIVPVHPGWNGTPHPEQLGSVADLAEAYLTLLDVLGSGPAAVLGSSFGGWIATEMALRGQGRLIDQLILMNALGPTVPGHPVTVPGPARDSAPQHARTGTQSGQPAAPSRRGPSPAALASLRAYTGPDMQDPNLLARLNGFRFPVLVLWGENDPVADQAYGRAYADAFPHARFALVPGAGHIPTREQPEATFTILDGFLTRVTDMPAGRSTPPIPETP